MREYEAMDAKGSGNEAVRHKSTGQASEYGETGGSRAEPLDPPKVLSRIPDLTATEPEEYCVASPPSSAWKMWNARLTSGVLFVGSLILFVAALVTFNKKNDSDVSLSNDSPTVSQPGNLESASNGASLAKKWIGGSDNSSRQTLSRAPAFVPSGESSVPTLNGTAGPDRRGAEQPKTAAWGGQPQWPIAGDAAPSNAWNRSPDVRTDSEVARSSPWPGAAQAAAAAQSDASWRSQPVAANAGSLPADSTWGRPASGWGDASNQSPQAQPARPITWNEPAQVPVAVPVQPSASVTATRGAGWNTPAAYQTPADAMRTSPGYGDSRSSYRTASRETSTDAYRAANPSTTSYPTNAYPANSYSNGAYSTNTNPANPPLARSYSTNAYPSANSSTGAYPATTSANGYQGATPVNNSASGAVNGSQANYSPWGGNNTYSTTGMSGSGATAYPTVPASASSTQTTEWGTAQFEGGIDKPTVRTTYDGTGSSIR